MKILKNFFCPAVAIAYLIAGGCGQIWTEENIGNFNVIHNGEGQTLAYSPSSGVKILTVNRLAFKDLNRNGKLDPYEDWRLPVNERAADLVSQMSVEQIAGLMLYSSHQSIPSGGSGFGRPGTYGGVPFSESGAKPGDISDQQKQFLTEDNLRHVLITSVESPEVAADWNNNVQAFVEGIGLGIPVNTSSDPRHGSVPTRTVRVAVFLLRKEIVWVEIHTSVNEVGLENGIIYGSFDDLPEGQYRLLLTEAMNNTKIDVMDFVVYADGE